MRAIEIWLLNYLLNSLWQVPLVFVAMLVATRTVRPLGLQEEHRLWCTTLPFAAVLPMLSVNAIAVVNEVRYRLTSGGAHSAHSSTSVTVAMSDGQAVSGLSISPGWLHAALWVYVVIFAYSLVRLVWGLWQTHRLRRTATLVPLDSAVGAAWFRYAKIFGVLADEIATVPGPSSPVTLGVFRRVLLLPEAWLETVDAEDMDAAIAHECAHMQRRDFAKNLVYRLVTLPVSYHPLVWVMLSRVVETREMLCDAMAAEAVAGRERYARSLLRLAANLVDGVRQPNLHVIGIFDANNFERRVMNLTMKRTNAGRLRRMAVKAVCAILGAGTTLSALALRTQVAVPAAATPGSIATQTLTPSVLPESFVRAVPRSGTGAPAQTITVESLPSPTLATEASATSSAPAPMRIRVVTPARVEPDAAQVPTTQEVDHISRVSGDVIAGNIETRVNPVYPQAAKDAHIQGTVVLDAVIGADGNIKGLRLVSGPEELKHSAWAAVSQWTYKPYLLNGVPTEVETTITVNYQMF